MVRQGRKDKRPTNAQACLRPRALWTLERRAPRFCVMEQSVGRIPGAFAAPDPEACRDMKQVRQGVDEIDLLLVALIARRQGYMDAAARIKPSRAVVRDEARIAQVLANVRAEAAARGLSWNIAEPVWRELMERCIAYEFTVWDTLREAADRR